MKNLFLLLVMSLMLTNIYAQRTPEDRAELAVEKLTTVLDLSEDQEEEINALYLEKYTKKNAANADESMTPQEAKAAKKAAKKAARAAFNTDLEAILTSEQMEDYQEYIAKRKKKKKKKKSKSKSKSKKAKEKLAKQMAKVYTPEEVEIKSQKMTDKMTRSLRLDGQQSTKIKAIYSEYYQQLTVINTQVDEDIDEDEDILYARTSLTETMKENIEAVLTEEQIERREEKKARKKKRRG